MASTYVKKSSLFAKANAFVIRKVPLLAVAELAVMSAYYYYNESKKTPDFPLPVGTSPFVDSPDNHVSIPMSPPTSLPTSFKKSPSVASPLQFDLDNRKSLKDYLDVSKSSFDSDFSAKSKEVEDANTEQLVKAGSSLFLQNQSLSKASLDDIALGVTSLGAVNGMTYALLEGTLNSIATSLSILAKATQVVPVETAQANKSVSYAPIDYTKYYEKMAAHADSAKVVSDHAATPKTVTDLDGLAVSVAAPMELAAQYHATKARTATDVNSMEYEDADFPNLLDTMPSLKFFGRSTMFDPNFQDNGINPFSHSL